jgi:hypothetical protein
MPLPFFFVAKEAMVVVMAHALTCNDNNNNPTPIVVYES